jgi:ubiquinone/menaquinone biosynthesis C-methylase UbiE
MVITHAQAQAFYDRFGKKQDAQAFYEDAALEDLIAHAAFEQADRVFEVGCGTGRFAACLLSKHLSPSASYLGIDVSQTMIEIAGRRIAPYEKRAKAARSDGSMLFPIPDRSIDRVVSTYMFDLLSETDIHQAIAEAHRVLTPGGKICLAGLTQGVSLASRVVCALWSAIFRLHAPWVGGCRPIRLDIFFSQQSWSVDYRKVVTQFGVPSEVLIASPKRAPDHAFNPGALNRRSG